MEETSFGEYIRAVDAGTSKIRVIRNTFKTEDSDDVWIYLKVYNLSH